MQSKLTQMSVRKEKILSLAGINHENKSKEQLQALFSKALNNGMHGLCFSPYEEGQEPGDIITEAQIRKRMEICLALLVVRKLVILNYWNLNVIF